MRRGVITTFTSARFAGARPILHFHLQLVVRLATGEQRRRARARRRSARVGFRDHVADLGPAPGGRPVRDPRRRPPLPPRPTSTAARPIDGQVRRRAIEPRDRGRDRLGIVHAHVEHIGLAASGGEQRDDQAAAVEAGRDGHRRDALCVERLRQPGRDILAHRHADVGGDADRPLEGVERGHAGRSCCAFSA
jgi:hypothetical protein